MKKSFWFRWLLLPIVMLFVFGGVYAKDDSNQLHFCSGEHVLIGNAISIYLPVGSSAYADLLGAKADFRSGLHLKLEKSLSFGKIIVTPDFFADPNSIISDGQTFTDRRANFEKNFRVFLESQKSTVDKIFFYTDLEVDTIQYVIALGWPASEAYHILGKGFSLNYFLAYPPAIQLVLTNWDHFGKNAWVAYEAGHAEALQTAVKAHQSSDLTTKRKLLVLAYAKEGYADHFLSDQFAGGHMRTPRKELVQVLPKDFASNAVAGLLSMFMHDEDNLVGVQASNLHGDKWLAYGDEKYLDKEDDDNVKLVIKTLQESSDEVKQAFLTGIMKTPDEYAAWQLIPDFNKSGDFLNYVNKLHGTLPIFAYDPETKDVLRRPDISKLHPASLPISKSYFLPHGTLKGWNEWVTLLELLFNNRPTKFLGHSTNIVDYVTGDGKLNEAGYKLLFSSLNVFEEAMFCADKTLDNNLRNYLSCPDEHSFVHTVDSRGISE